MLNFFRRTTAPWWMEEQGYSPCINNVPIIEVFYNNADTSERMFKFLSFQLDKKLDFKSHKAYVINKLNGINCELRKLRNQVSTGQKVFNDLQCLIQKWYMEYGISVWPRGKNLERIEKLQKKWDTSAVEGPTSLNMFSKTWITQSETHQRH